MRANFVLSGVAAGIRRNAAMTIALILSTAIALTFVGAAVLANSEITKFRKVYEDKINVSVYLCTDFAHDVQETANRLAVQEHHIPASITCDKHKVTSSSRTNQIRAMLKSDPLVRSVKYVSESEAVKRGKEQQPLTAKFLTKGSLPASFIVRLADVKKDYPAFAAKYGDGQVQGIDMVSNQIGTINTLLSLIDSARWFSIVIALIVLVASILLIANTIQVAAGQRKNETSIMRLVGASRWMTELPFMLETVIASAIGGLLAIGFIFAGKHFVLDGVFAGQTKTGTIPNLTLNDVLVAGGAGLIVGVALSAITAFITLRLYVRL
jgi:cell division transport system permease protein